MRLITSLSIVCLCAAAGAAQSSKTAIRRASETRLVSGPMVGYAVQPAPLEVRAILGVPGATHYSDPFAPPSGVESISIAPHHRWLLVLRSEGATAVAWKPETGHTAELPAVTGRPDLVAFSNSGSDAIFYWRDERRMAIYRGLPEAPALMAESSEVDWPSDLRKLALSEGAGLAAGFTKHSQVLLLAANGEAVRRLLFDEAPVTALAFRGVTNGLIVVARGVASLLIVDDPLQGGTPRQLAELPAPAGAGAQLDASDERYAVVADYASQLLMRVDTMTGATRIVAVEGSAEMQSLRSRGGVILQGAAGAAARIVVSGETGDELSYVPALVPQPEAVIEVQPEVQ
jgi:hypothetical protein